MARAAFIGGDSAKFVGVAVAAHEMSRVPLEKAVFDDYADFLYRAQSWNRARRVVARWSGKGVVSTPGGDTIRSTRLNGPRWSWAAGHMGNIG